VPTVDLTLEEIGNDVSTMADGDLDLTFAPIYGSRVCAEGVFRRWFSKRGRVFWARNMGRNAGALVGSDMTATELERWKIALVQEALAVDGVRGCTVSFERDEETGALELRSDLDTVAGKSELNVQIGNAGPVIAASIRERNGR
jgi:hypothetical protein